MKRTAFALLAAASLFVIEGWNAPVAHATAPTTWTVTATEVAVQPGEGTAIAPAADKPAEQRYAVKATAKLGDEVIAEAVYPFKDFDSEAACKAALDGGDADLKEANDGLKARVEAAKPGVEVTFSCIAE